MKLLYLTELLLKLLLYDLKPLEPFELGRLALHLGHLKAEVVIGVTPCLLHVLIRLLDALNLLDKVLIRLILISLYLFFKHADVLPHLAQCS